ncbi:TonB-dependent receptor plug domain-containing protein [Vibrio sp. HN007]|uniref:TonB-dependent receptor plug domain-containing protein n=1 Tax=Vibrio iocasae TaxID=3098914 RepID=UPI0035D49975
MVTRSKIVGVLPLFFAFAGYSQDFTELSLEDLMQIEVTSVSKKSEKLSNAAAAVYVVTQNEIRRSGATSIPEVLKFVPGMHVAQVDNNKWAIGMRGFNGRLENKLLVLIDGRSVYTSTYSGVFWENHEYALDDIERIEVIRGPGATLWGTNAVNGVINIITKEAADTKGTLIKLAAGNELKGLAVGRFGADVSENTQMRVYAKTRKLDENVDTKGNKLNTDADYLQSGFRMDWQGDMGHLLTVQGDIFDHDLDQDLTAVATSAPFIPYRVQDTVGTNGGNLNTRWSKPMGLDSELSVQLWYDYYERDDIRYDERSDTIDLSVEHQFKPFTDNTVVWGGGYRWNQNKIESGLLFKVDQEKDELNIWNLFAQDTIEFTESDISLTLGTKVEGNTYSDIEVQPNIRMSWVPTMQFTLWGAISRATRIPSRGENDISVVTLSSPAGTIPGMPLPLLVTVEGSDSFDSEEVNAYELGMRWMPISALALDWNIYFNDYENVRSYTQGTPDCSSMTLCTLELTLANNTSGHAYGSELLATWHATEYSRYKLSYSFNEVDLNDIQSNVYNDSLISLVEDRSPNHQVSAWASYDIASNWELDLRVFYKDEQKWTLYDGDNIEAFTNADVRLGWLATDWVQLALVGKNILHSSHSEFNNSETWTTVTAIERSVFVSATMNW